MIIKFSAAFVLLIHTVNKILLCKFLCPSQDYRVSKPVSKTLTKVTKEVLGRAAHETCPSGMLLIPPLHLELTSFCPSPPFSQLLICLSQLLIIPVLICVISAFNNNFLWERH